MDGEVSLAFGFELTPLVARAEEFEALAAEVQSERRALRLARERITLARRDITKMILLGMEEALPATGRAITGNIWRLSGVSSAPRACDLEAIAADLEDFSAEILKHLELFTNSQIQAPMSPIPSATNRIQNQTFENLNLFSRRKTGATSASPILRPMVQLKPSKEGKGRQPQPAQALGTPLPMVLEACPDILDYIAGREGQGSDPLTSRTPSWPEFLKAAELVRAMLGISRMPGAMRWKPWGRPMPRLSSRRSCRRATRCASPADTCGR